MIKNILELLPLVEGGTENIQIAKGKYKFPETVKEAFNNFKKELWQNK